MWRPSSASSICDQGPALRGLSVLAVTMAATLASAASASPLAPPIQAMIETAFAGSDDATITAVLNVAKKTAPESLAEIDALEAKNLAARSAAKAAQAQADQARLGSAGWLTLWTGELELGGAQTTGSAQDTEAHLGAKLSRKGLHWTQKLNVQADYGAAARQVTTNRINAAYQSQLKLSPTGYTYGLAEYERDQFLGYRDRYTVGLGFGLTPVDRPNLKLQLDAGPAVRYARYDGKSNDSEAVARGSVTLVWVARPGLTLTENGAVVIDRSRSSARSTLALDTNLLGPLKARLSYNVQFERRETEARDQLDTITRATLVYGF